MCIYVPYVQTSRLFVTIHVKYEYLHTCCGIPAQNQYVFYYAGISVSSITLWGYPSADTVYVSTVYVKRQRLRNLKPIHC